MPVLHRRTVAGDIGVWGAIVAKAAAQVGRHTARARFALRASVALGVLLWVPNQPFAQPESPTSGRIASAGRVAGISRIRAIETEHRATGAELAALSTTISLTRDTIEALDAEIAALAQDRGRIRAAMIAAAAAQKAIEKEIAATERRVGALAGDEAELKASLRARRGLLAEVLGALQRIGRKPPPALLVNPDDALGSVRSAILLGAVVPRIRTETETLAEDLRQLAALKREIGVEKQRFVDGMTRQKQEEARLARLFSAKEKLETDSRDRRKAASARAAELAAKATSLQDLIASLETEAESARLAEAAARRAEAAERLAAAERARAAEEAAAAERVAAAEAAARAEAAAAAEAARLAALGRRQQLEEAAEATARSPDERGTPPIPAAPAEAAVKVAAVPEKTYDIASLRREMARIEPTAAFSTMKGRLSVPVSGDVRTPYGGSDGIGRPASGMTFSARAGDLVTAPADGQVLYSGPFRSYGQLLILDAGDGYHVVLAGMTEVDVEVGQVVLSGEPVAVMGARRLASAAAADFVATEPSLYVEFRKDGKPVDPSPWWAVGPSGRTRNDS